MGKGGVGGGGGGGLGFRVLNQNFPPGLQGGNFLPCPKVFV